MAATSSTARSFKYEIYNSLASQSIDPDRIAGMIIGGATGDALGSPSEFKYNYKSMPYTGWMIYRSRLLIRMQGYHTAVIGQVTDDTEMALTLLRSLIANRGYQTEAVILSYLQWAYGNEMTYIDSSGQTHTKITRPFGIGINTKSLFGQIKNVATYRKRYQKTFDQMPWVTFEQAAQYSTLPRQSEAILSGQANGSLMRLYPLALLPDKTRELATILDCQLTNPSVVNLDCSLFAVRVLRALLLGYNSQAALTMASELKYHSFDMIKTVRSALHKEPRDISSGGWILHSIYMAVRALNEFTRYDQALDWIISSGGDTDTNASIAGAWLGASLGYQQMLTEGERYIVIEESDRIRMELSSSADEETVTRTAYNISKVLAATTLDGDYPRPEKYRLHNFAELVQAASALANST